MKSTLSKILFTLFSVVLEIRSIYTSVQDIFSVLPLEQDVSYLFVQVEAFSSEISKSLVKTIQNNR